MKKPAKEERRRRRSSELGEALRFQLDACVAEGELEAIVVSDDMGLCVAESGAGDVQDELAARLPGTMRSGLGGSPVALPAAMRGVALKQISLGFSTLFACALGGDSDERAAHLERVERGFRRILATC